MHFRDIYITKLAFYGETFLAKYIPHYQVLISGRLESEIRGWFRLCLLISVDKGANMGLGVMSRFYFMTLIWGVNP